jgi:general secretion pathway protein K
MRKEASVLVGLLWCMALLSVVVISVLHTARLDLTVQKNYGDQIQARYLALAGIEKAKALLYHDATERRTARKNHTGKLFDEPDEFRQMDLGPGQFSVLRRGNDAEGGGIIYGVADEESRLNVNYAQAEEIAKIDGMSPDIVAAILDWRDEDKNVSPGGAEDEYYMGLQPPRLPRNGLFQSTRELLMVRGITTANLLGEKGQGDELPDSDTEANANDSLDGGWAALLSVDGWMQNLNAAGEKRIPVQTATEKDLTGITGITPEIAKAIVTRRQSNKFESLADLLEVPLTTANPRTGAATPNNNGPKAITDDLLSQIADDVAIDSTSEIPGLININTAPSEVLRCLGGVTPELAQAIVTHRRSNGFFDNIAGVLKVPGMTREIFKQMAGRITARSETFRIVSEGVVTSTGARHRIQAVVHVGSQTVETLSYREDL